MYLDVANGSNSCCQVFIMLQCPLAPAKIYRLTDWLSTRNRVKVIDSTVTAFLKGCNDVIIGYNCKSSSPQWKRPLRVRGIEIYGAGNSDIVARNAHNKIIY